MQSQKITACFCAYDLGVDPRTWETTQQIVNNGERVDGFESDMSDWINVSEINSRNKYGLGYADCISLIGVGRDISSGKNISFMTHQNPDGIKEFQTTDVRVKFEHIVETFQTLCLPGSVDTIILGGGADAKTKIIDKKSQQLIELTQAAVQCSLGSIPEHVGGPAPFTNSVFGVGQCLYLDTMRRTVTVVREMWESENLE